MPQDWWAADQEVKPAKSAAKNGGGDDWWRRDADARPAPSAPATAPLAATGEVHDGDTFRVSDGRNARLSGIDAFELTQTGRSSSGAVVPLGHEARTRLAPLAQPAATVTPTGAVTYGRPVVTLDNGGDAGAALLHDGLALSEPQYLRDDPQRLTDYTQVERLARLNRRGAHADTYQTPSSFRHGAPDPWAAPQAGVPGNSDAVFFDEPTPFQGLKPEVAKGYLDIWQDRTSRPEDLIAFAKTNGFALNEAETRKKFATRDKGGRISDEISYYKPPRVLTDPGDGAVGATLRGVADPINMLDEMGAVVDTVGVAKDRENLFNSDRRFGDILANNLDQNRSILDYDDAEHPYARFAGQLGSGLAIPGASVEGVGFTAARKVLQAGGTRFAAKQAARAAVVSRLGVTGAVEGGLAGAGAGETARERAGGAIIGGTVGTGIGVVTGIAGPKIAEAARGLFRSSSRTERKSAVTLGQEAVEKDAASATPPPAPVRAEPAVGEKVEPATAPMTSHVERPPLGGPAAPTSPRTGVARPLTADVTGAQRTAEAARVEPRDVLPLPANTVDGIGEAERIATGRLDPVRAPNEADTLGRRNIPSPIDGTKTMPKRGPLDLVTWLRTQGGLKPETTRAGRMNELDHAGIDNVPRKLDFAGGEGRFGKLVDPENGLTYDDAAQAAREAGYFPDHAERPTIPEFLDALTGTHSGRNRVFHPDDFAEVDAFNDARRARHDIEGAKARGAPLVSDRGQPVDMADLEANAPPVHAYEEWGENAPNLAGNIRVDKLNSPQAIKRALFVSDQKVGGFDAATRGTITRAETANLASELGMTPADLLTRRKGQAFNAEQALAARQILAKSANELVNLAKKVAALDNPGDEATAAFREAWTRHVAIQEEVAGATAEAGRALAQFRMTADSRAVTGDVLRALAEGPHGVDRIKQAAELIVENASDPANLNLAATRAMKPRFSDKLVELYYNSILSGPQTHVVNMLSNTMTALSQIPEHAVAAVVGAPRAIAGPSRNDRILFSELGARGVGLLQGTKEGLRQARSTFRTGETSDLASKVESHETRAISGVKGSVIRTPTRALSAEDELFKAMARRMELSGLAVRQARADGLSGAAAKKRAAELLANPTDAMLTKAFAYGRYVTFQRPLGPIGQAVSRMTQAAPILKLVLPFVRTPTNILKFAIERSPAAPLLKEWRADFGAGGARRDLAVARVLVGSGAMAVTMELAANGHITGGGPADDNVKGLRRADGWQPYSFKIGDKYYSYQRLDPFATTLGIAADFADLQSHMTDKQRDQVAGLLVASTLKNLSSKTWLSGVADLSEAVNDPERFGASYLRRRVASVVVPAVAAQAARTIDPTLREAQSVLDTIRSRVPGLSSALPAKLDVWGRPIENEGGLGPNIASPVWQSTAKNDPVNAAALASGATVSAPSKTIGKRTLTDAEYHRYSMVAGQLAHQRLADIVGGAGFKALGAADRAETIAKVVRDARRETRSEMFGPPTARDTATELETLVPAL